MQDHPRLTIASPDTIEYAFQELVQPIKKEATTTGKEHYINEHKACLAGRQGFNSLLTKLCRQTGLLKQDEKYTMDYAFWQASKGYSWFHNFNVGRVGEKTKSNT